MALYQDSICNFVILLVYKLALTAFNFFHLRAAALLCQLQTSLPATKNMLSFKTLFIASLVIPSGLAQQKPPLLSSAFGVPGLNASFDYVIVGGGTAGLTLAARLAENFTVAVIEAGGFYETDNGNLSVIPGDAIQFVGADVNDFQPLIDWGFATTPQPVC